MPKTASRTLPFVVFVRYPNNPKEYAYLCSDPNVVQGSRVRANHCDVTVVRTASYCKAATKHIDYVSDDAIDRRASIETIMKRLEVIEGLETSIARYSKLKSPEAKKLVAELKELCK